MSRGTNNAGDYIGALYHSELNLNASNKYSEIVGGTWSEDSGNLIVTNETASLFKNTEDVTTSIDLSGIKFSELSALNFNFTGDANFRVRINTKPLNDNNDFNSSIRSSYLLRLPSGGYTTATDISLTSENTTTFNANYEDIVFEANDTKSQSKMSYTESAIWRDDELLSIDVIATTTVNITSVELKTTKTGEESKKINYNYSDYSTSIDKVVKADENRVIASYLVYKNEKSYVGSGILASLSNGGILAESAMKDLTFEEMIENLVKMGKTDDDDLKDEVIALKLDSKIYADVESDSTKYYTVDNLSGSYTPAELTNSITQHTDDTDYMTRQYVVDQHVYSIASLSDSTAGSGFNVSALELRGGNRWFDDISSSPVYKTNDTDAGKQLNTSTSFSVADLVDIYSLDEILAGSGDNAYDASELKTLGILGDEIKYVCDKRTKILSEIKDSDYDSVAGIKLLKTKTSNGDDPVTYNRTLQNKEVDSKTDSDLSAIVSLINTTSSTPYAPYTPTELKSASFTTSNVCDNTTSGAQFTINELYGEGSSAEYSISDILSGASRLETEFQNTNYKRDDWVTYANDVSKQINTFTYDKTDGLIESVLIEKGNFSAGHMFNAGFTLATDINSMRMYDIENETENYTAINMIAAGYLAKNLTRIDATTAGLPSVTGKFTNENGTLHRNFDNTDEVLYETTEILTSTTNGIEANKLLDFDDKNIVFNLQDLKSAFIDNISYTNYKLESIIASLDDKITNENKTNYFTRNRFYNSGYTESEIKSGINSLVTTSSFTYNNLKSNYEFLVSDLLNTTTSYSDYTAVDIAIAYSNDRIVALTTIIGAFSDLTKDQAISIGFTEDEYNNAKAVSADLATLYVSYKALGELDTLVTLKTLDLLLTEGYTLNQLKTDGVSPSLLGITIITDALTNVSTNEFVVEDLNSEFNLEVQATLHSEATPTLTYDAVVDIDVNLFDFLKVFKFNTDSEDMVNTNTSDIEYFVFSDYWKDDTMPNPMNAQVSENPIYTNTKQMKNDFVRHIAAKKFNTHFAVDLFSNETELVNALESIGNAIVNKVKDDVISDKHTSDTGSTEDDSLCKLSKTLLKQILSKNPTRVYEQLKKYEVDNSGMLATSKVSIPLIAGDKVLFVSTIKSHSSDTDSEGNVITRSYLIRCTLV